MSTVKGIERYLLKGRVKIGGKIREPGETVELTEALHAQLLAAGNVEKEPFWSAVERDFTQLDEPKPAAKPAAKAKAKPAPKSAAKPKAADQPKEPAPAPEGSAGTDEQNTPPEGAPGTPSE